MQADPSDLISAKSTRSLNNQVFRIHPMCGQPTHPRWIQLNQSPTRRIFGHPTDKCWKSLSRSYAQTARSEMTLEAAKKNFLTLKYHNFNLGIAIQAQSKSPVG
jgi:hypothetical protein